MSKFKNVFCVYEYDNPQQPIDPNANGLNNPQIEQMITRNKHSMEQLEERWKESRSLSQNRSIKSQRKAEKQVRESSLNSKLGKRNPHNSYVN